MTRAQKLDRIAATCVLAFVSACLTTRAVRADQIVVLVDEHGRKIYVNTGEAGRHSGDWMSRSFRPIRAGGSALSPADIDNLVEQTANRYEIDPRLVHAIIQVESQYNANAISRKGAIGLMQLLPSTAIILGVENPFDPKQNLEGGVNYLKHLLNVFGGNLALSLAAYNAGERSVLRQWRIPPLPETRDYVRKVTTRYQSGDSDASSYLSDKGPPKAPITRYTDAQGVVHYTNVE